MSFTTMVSLAREIVEREKEIHYTRLAYLMRVNPQKAIQLLKALSEVDDRVVYDRGVAKWVGDEKTV